MADEKQFTRRIEQIEALTAKLDGSGDPELRACAKDLVRLIMDFHGAGLERMMQMIGQAGEAGQNITERFDRDELIRSLLLLYGLHPLGFEERVRRALEKANSSLRAHGVGAELIGTTDGLVRVRLTGSKGCGAAGAKAAVEEAIYDAAPDIAQLVIEQPEMPSATFLPLASLLRQPANAQRGSSQP